MSRFVFKCKDEQGNIVHFQTSDKKGDVIVQAYDHYLSWLEKHGFTIVGDEPVDIEPKEYTTTYTRKASPKKPKKVWKIDGFVCPKCGERAWDNREKVRSGEFSAKSPHFACSDNKVCKWAVWKDGYELPGGGDS